MDDLLDLIICTECKTRVEYHGDRDGYMSCECWVKATQEEPYPAKWLEIEDRKVNLCGGCRKDINERLVFRCSDCGLPFHQVCLDHHCKHGNQKQELRSENLFLKQQVTNLEEYMLKGVAFRDELHSRLALLEKVAKYAEHTPNCGYTFYPVTQTGEMIGCTCGLETLRAALKASDLP